jgi:endoglucanase
MRATIILCVLAGCASFRPPAEGGASGAETGRACVIEDAEDGDDQVRRVAGRGGYLYTYADELGTRVSPGGDAPPVADGGAGGSAAALRLRATLAAAGAGEAFAGLGLSFREPKGPYDASRYRGLSFWAKRAPGSAARLRLKVPDAATDPDGGQCKECYNDFGVEVQLEETWTRYVVDFADLKQEGGWGEPRPASLDTARLYGIQWQVSGAGAQAAADVDVWIDDVEFLGCE